MEGEPKSRPVEVAEGRMRGLVTDSETGAPVSGVRIRAKAKSPSSTPRTVTGPDGMWLLEGLPASTYRIGLSGRGYRKTVVRDVEVGTGDVLIDVPIALEPR